MSKIYIKTKVEGERYINTKLLKQYKLYSITKLRKKKNEPLYICGYIGKKSCLNIANYKVIFWINEFEKNFYGQLWFVAYVCKRHIRGLKHE
jgi:hypothetical protein